MLSPSQRSSISPIHPECSQSMAAAIIIRPVNYYCETVVKVFWSSLKHGIEFLCTRVQRSVFSVGRSVGRLQFTCRTRGLDDVEVE